jgi:hypothetical protein
MDQVADMEDQMADMPVQAEEDEDVLHTIPVFLSQELAKSLYMLYYPLRPADRPYQDDLGAWRTTCLRVPAASCACEYFVFCVNMFFLCLFLEL